MSQVNVRIDKLVDELSKLRGGKVTIERMALETNLAQGTVRKWVKGNVDRIDGETMATFMDYFCEQLKRDITPNDVLVYTRN